MVGGPPIAQPTYKSLLVGVINLSLFPCRVGVGFSFVAVTVYVI
jgi:hypothetical protein